MLWETLEHGLYWVIITDKTGIPKVTESRHVAFDRSKFPGAPDLENYVENESDSDESFVDESDECESVSEIAVYINVKDDIDRKDAEKGQELPDTNDATCIDYVDSGDDDDALVFEDSRDEDSDEDDIEDSFEGFPD